MIFNSLASMKGELITKSQKREISSDEIEEIRKKQKKHASEEESKGGGGGDGSSIEVVKRPRGRPPGSKNKPKPPVIITREAEPSAAMRPHMLEIPGGHDVIESLVRFCRRRNLGICVLAGNGTVSNVTLRQPSHPAASAAPTASSTIGFHGRFEILSISATFLPPALAIVGSVGGGVSISLAGPQGQIVGGIVAGPLLAAGTVVVVAAAFENPTFHRLPVEDDVSVSVSMSVSGGRGDAEDHHQQQEQEEQHYSHRGYHHHAPTAATVAAESCGMSIYSSHFPSEVIWAPTARPSHPPPF